MGMIMAELALKLSPLDAWKKRNKEREAKMQELKTARARLRKQPAEGVLGLRTRRLADTARMEAKDVTAMSPSELVLHRRRLAHGVRVSPVLAALMEQIEEAQRNHA